MAGSSEVEDGRSELVRLAVQLIIEEALEGATRDALGRDYYARGARPGAGYRPPRPARARTDHRDGCPLRIPGVRWRIGVLLGAGGAGQLCRPGSTSLLGAAAAAGILSDRR